MICDNYQSHAMQTKNFFSSSLKNVGKFFLIKKSGLWKRPQKIIQWRKSPKVTGLHRQAVQRKRPNPQNSLSFQKKKSEKFSKKNFFFNFSKSRHLKVLSHKIFFKNPFVFSLMTSSNFIETINLHLKLM